MLGRPQTLPRAASGATLSASGPNGTPGLSGTRRMSRASRAAARHRACVAPDECGAESAGQRVARPVARTKNLSLIQTWRPQLRLWCTWMRRALVAAWSGQDASNIHPSAACAAASASPKNRSVIRATPPNRPAGDGARASGANAQTRRDLFESWRCVDILECSCRPTSPSPPARDPVDRCEHGFGIPGATLRARPGQDLVGKAP